jgi:AbrB family looped-hinge helix DNA binding protein
MKKKTRVCSHPFGNICGVTSLGERGQVVVPVEARKILKAKAGDQFVVFEHDGFLILLPEKMVSLMMQKITKVLGKK